MPHFTTTYPKFFKDLTKNNTTAWFNENRKTYEQEVKKPFTAFIEELIARIQKIDKTVQIKAADAVTRINKDIRFSKDKIPYNLYMGAIISRYGRKSKEYPGIYIQLGADKIMIFGGAYQVEKESLHKIRTAIAKNGAGFQKAITNAAFVKKFGSIQGEKNKVLPPEFKALMEKQPLIANKGFYFFAELPAKHITDPKLVDLIMDYFAAGKPVNDFLVQALEK